jgi:hypothetical protein
LVAHNAGAIQPISVASRMNRAMSSALLIPPKKSTMITAALAKQYATQPRVPREEVRTERCNCERQEDEHEEGTKGVYDTVSAWRGRFHRTWWETTGWVSCEDADRHQSKSVQAHQDRRGCASPIGSKRPPHPQAYNTFNMPAPTKFTT